MQIDFYDFNFFSSLPCGCLVQWGQLCQRGNNSTILSIKTVKFKKNGSFWHQDWNCPLWTSRTKLSDPLINCWWHFLIIFALTFSPQSLARPMSKVYSKARPNDKMKLHEITEYKTHRCTMKCLSPATPPTEDMFGWVVQFATSISTHAHRESVLIVVRSCALRDCFRVCLFVL